jgi:chromate transport protein ChrA
MRRGVLVSGVAATLVLTAVGALTKGADGALSALAGSLLAFVVILVGLLAIAVVVAGDPAMSMAGAGVVYLGQLILLVAALLALSGAPWLDGTVAAVSALVATVLLQIGQVSGYVRSRHVLFPQAGRA